MVGGNLSNTNRNFIIAYILLVGVPLLGLAGVLKVGRTLTAPISIDGVWKVQSNGNTLSTEPCSQAISSLANSTLAISQSGRSLVLTFNNSAKTSALGAIEGKSLNAQLVLKEQGSSGAGCGANQPMTFAATVGPKTDLRSITGTLSLNGCSSCSPVAFQAERLPRTRSGGIR